MQASTHKHARSILSPSLSVPRSASDLREGMYEKGAQEFRLLCERMVDSLDILTQTHKQKKAREISDA